MDSNMSLSDIAAVTGNNGFGGNSGMFWIFALLLLAWGGNGFGWGNRGYGFDGSRVATTEDVNTTANFTRLENQVRANENYIQQLGTNLGNGICDLGYEMAQQAGQNRYDMAVGFGNVRYDTLAQTDSLARQVADCCCSQKQLILESKYQNSQEMSANTATVLSAIQSVKDQLAEDKIASLQAQVNNLTMQNAISTATCGVVKYPSASTYNAGFGPFCTPCCGNTNI